VTLNDLERCNGHYFALFRGTSAKIRCHLWLCICGVLRSPLSLTWSHNTYY